MCGSVTASGSICFFTTSSPNSYWLQSKTKISCPGRSMHTPTQCCCSIRTGQYSFSTSVYHDRFDFTYPLMHLGTEILLFFIGPSTDGNNFPTMASSEDVYFSNNGGKKICMRENEPSSQVCYLAFFLNFPTCDFDLSQSPKSAGLSENSEITLPMEESSNLRSREFLNSVSRPDPIHKPLESPATQFSFPRLLLWFDQSTRVKALVSWSVFFLFAVGVPMISHFVLICADCDFKHHRPYDALVQLSLSIFAGISFVSLSDWSKKYGIRMFLFLDKLKDVSEKVRLGYEAEIQRSTKMLAIFVLPSLTLEAIYRIWWYASGSNQIPYIFNPMLSHFLACTLQLSSWLYRTSLFIIACIVYQIICHLQILRLDEFARSFASEITDFSSTLAEHLKIRRQLKIVSHRFRRFILLSLFFVTATQFMALLTTMRASVPFNIYQVGELALCSISLVSGLFICLKSATQMTHKAQSVTSIATKWNVCATLDTFDDLDDGETPKYPTTRQHFQILSRRRNVIQSSDEEEADSDLDNTTIHPIYARAISFQKRQALVTYLENNKAGITVYGFLVDKTWLRMIFSIELALLLWLLKKTIVNIT